MTRSLRSVSVSSSPAARSTRMGQRQGARSIITASRSSTGRCELASKPCVARVRLGAAGSARRSVPRAARRNRRSSAGHRSDRGHLGRAGTSIRRLPGWCSRATCRSSTRATLQHLIAASRPTRLATAYRSAHDGLPEPLCAIYEPSARDATARLHRERQALPAQVPDQTRTRRCSISPSRAALDNVNTPEEFDAAAARLGWKEPTGRARPCACSTSRCCASRRAAARRRSIPSARDAGRAVRGAAQRDIRSRCPPRCCASRVNAEFGDWQTPLHARRRGRLHSAGGGRMKARSRFSQAPLTPDSYRGDTRGPGVRRLLPHSKAGCAITTKATP